MKRSTIFLIIIGVILLFGLLDLIYYLSNKPTKEIIFNNAKNLSLDDHIKWSKDKKIILTEYSDFQCPACKLWGDYFKELEKSKNADFEKIKNKVTFVFRNFPLTSIHKNAQTAALAAEAAGIQGKFFEMHDALYKNQTKWADLKEPKIYFISLAKELKLDINKFEKDLDSEKVKQKIKKDISSGTRAQVSSTPSFFINGKSISNLRTTNDLIKILLEEIK